MTFGLNINIHSLTNTHKYKCERERKRERKRERDNKSPFLVVDYISIHQSSYAANDDKEEAFLGFRNS